MIAMPVCIWMLTASLGGVDWTHGVASGDVTDGAAIVWTRASGPALVRLEVADDPAFASPAYSIELAAEAASDFTVKHDVTGLQPATDYWFRFVDVADVGPASPVGSFKTLPPGDSAASLRFVISGDSNARFAPLHIFEFAAAERPDFGLWDGDVIYSDAPADDLGVARTLDEYRDKYKQMYADAPVREFLGSVAVWASWDDHEVANDYDGGDLESQITPERQRDAYQAFFEYMPIREQSVPDDEFRTYRSFRHGSWAEFFILDGRQYRAADAARSCAADAQGTVEEALLADTPACQAVIRDLERTILGQEQFTWLRESLLASDAKYKFIINGPPVTSFLGVFPFDRWDGYDADRRRLLEFIDSNGLDNVILLSTDFHLNAYNPDVTSYFRRHRRDYELPNGVAVIEAIVGPIGTQTFESAVIDTGRRALGGWPFGELLVDVGFGLAAQRVIMDEELSFVASDAFAYLLVEIDESGELTFTYRGYDAGLTDPAGAETLFRTTPATAPRPLALPCFPVAVFPLGLLALTLHRTRRRKGYRP